MRYLLSCAPPPPHCLPASPRHKRLAGHPQCLPGSLYFYKYIFVYTGRRISVSVNICTFALVNLVNFTQGFTWSEYRQARGVCVCVCTSVTRVFNTPLYMTAPPPAPAPAPGPHTPQRAVVEVCNELVVNHSICRSGKLGTV
jgi:hypothetical protein